MANGKLILIPTIISEGTQADVIPAQVRNVLPDLRFFFAENVRTARRYLSSLKIYPSIEPLHFEVLDKNTSYEALVEMFAPLYEGNNIGILSESGCPGIADPGALAVEFAHQHKIEVIPLVGPSSLLLALMGSGLNGQKFAFHGYLPVEKKELARVLKELERESAKNSQTQIFIETPYRNNSLVKTLLNTLSAETRLTIAVDLTGIQQNITTLTIKEWNRTEPEFTKTPAVFLFLAK
jgi:16S rRNA (cytidine1402-2'-O)-methyltransferase